MLISRMILSIWLESIHEFWYLNIYFLFSWINRLQRVWPNLGQNLHRTNSRRLSQIHFFIWSPKSSKILETYIFGCSYFDSEKLVIVSHSCLNCVFHFETAYTLTTPWDYRTQHFIFLICQNTIKFDIDDIGICDETLNHEACINDGEECFFF